MYLTHAFCDFTSEVTVSLFPETVALYNVPDSRFTTTLPDVGESFMVIVAMPSALNDASMLPAHIFNAFEEEPLIFGIFPETVFNLLETVVIFPFSLRKGVMPMG